VNDETKPPLWTVPIHGVVSALLAIAVVVTSGWSLFDGAITIVLAATAGAEIGVWVDRRHVVFRARLERELAAARRQSCDALADLEAAKRDYEALAAKERG
jgi:hypothetical protein